jgi:hypothetical protein
MTDNREPMSLRALADRLHESAWQKDVGLVDSDREDAAIALREYADYLTVTTTHPSEDARDAVTMARAFHDTYERLAPQFGYETRLSTRTFDPESANGKLMIAMCAAMKASVHD